MKCVSYTRTLPWKNHQSELTIAEQNQRIAAYLAEHKELDLLKKYSDRKNDEKARTAFDQMTDDGVERKFDCIIVASMYYCGPDFPAARQAIKETLYATGIDLIVLDEGLDTRTASRKEVEDYFEAKRCEMHAEIMFAWRRKQGAGFRLTNSVPFGYLRRNGESNMIKDEEVAPYLSEAFSRYASGQKMRDIAKWLNEQGVEPPMRHKKRILGKPYDAESDQWTTDMLRCLFRLIQVRRQMEAARSLRKTVMNRTSQKNSFMRSRAICARAKTKSPFGKATKSRIRWQSTLSVSVDAHFAGTRIRKQGRNFSIAVTAAHTRKTERI